jgi:hypothetical protein
MYLASEERQEMRVNIPTQQGWPGQQLLQVTRLHPHTSVSMVLNSCNRIGYMSGRLILDAKSSSNGP